MAGYYPDTCETEQPIHSCDPCGTREKGRIRAMAFVKKGFEFVDRTSLAEWQAAVQNQDVILIPATHGSLSDPTPLLGIGYGSAVEKLLGFQYSLEYFDPDYKNNCDFYNTFLTQTTYRSVYITETQGHMTDVDVTVIPMAPVEDELNSEVVWKVNVKWEDSVHPCPFDFPVDVLECFIPGE